MDGLALSLAPTVGLACQQTLKSAISCVGVGLHTGQRVHLTLRPAPTDHGIVFHRVDVGVAIPARFDRVHESRLATSITSEDDPAVSVGTIEHLMAALSGMGVDNAVVELDGPEVPILDGSASPYLFLIDCAGLALQDEPRRNIEIQRTVRAEDGAGFVELRPPAGFHGLEISLSIEFPAAVIGRQSVFLRLTPESFRYQISRYRTFALAEEVAAIQAAGLGRGGSLDNAIVVENDRVLNPGGLRAADEFARHKVLDAVGDLALAGAPICGRFVAHRSGHALNNRLLRALFANHGAWRNAASELLSAAA